jgi:heptosyltransferase-1
MPAVTDLCRARPGVAIDWLVEEAFVDLPALHPAVRQILPCAVRRWRRTPLASQTRKDIGALRRRLREARYGAVLDLQGLLKSALLASFAKVPIHGYDRPSAREPLAGLAYSHRHAVPRGLHAVERNRRLAAAAFGYAVEGEPDYGLATLSPEERAPEVLCLHATSRRDKLWPLERWQALAQALASEGRKPVFPWGSAAEFRRAQEIAAATPAAEVLPRLSLSMLAMRLAKAQAAIGVDTGLVHLAAATGTPVVALYLASDPALTGAMAGRAPALNLGGLGACPAVDEVLAALHSVSAGYGAAA